VYYRKIFIILILRNRNRLNARTQPKKKEKEKSYINTLWPWISPSQQRQVSGLPNEKIHLDLKFSCSFLKAPFNS